MSDFVTVGFFALGGALLAGGVLGALYRGFGATVSESRASDIHQWLLTTTLTLFVATEVREARAGRRHGSYDVSDLILRSVVSTSLLVGALIVVFVTVASSSPDWILGPAACLLYCTLLAATRPDRGPITREIAAREVRALKAEYANLDEALPPDHPKVTTHRYLMTITVVSLIPTIPVLASGIWWIERDNEFTVNLFVAISLSWLLTMCWFLLADTIMETRTYFRARAYGCLSASCTLLAFILLVQLIFFSLGALVGGIQLFADGNVSGSQWLFAIPALVLTTGSVSAIWGWPSPVLAALATRAEVQSNIRRLSRKLEPTPDFEI